MVKNQVTGSFILNPKGKEVTSRTFTAVGLEWEYAVEDAKESLKTSGPLPEAIAVLVSPSSVLWFLFTTPRTQPQPWPSPPSSLTLLSHTSLVEILLFHCLQEPGQGQGAWARPPSQASSSFVLKGWQDGK